MNISKWLWKSMFHDVHNVWELKVEVCVQGIENESVTCQFQPKRAGLLPLSWCFQSQQFRYFKSYWIVNTRSIWEKNKEKLAEEDKTEFYSFL